MPFPPLVRHARHSLASRRTVAQIFADGFVGFGKTKLQHSYHTI